jgi:CheY-like chemotaxis protein
MGKKILLADDSITIQKVIELTFSDEDFEVVTVGNGRLAMERIPEVRPDVVLCDVIMPEKDGYEVCEFIKKSPQFGNIPVLLLTGAFEPFDQERAARVGCDGFLAKPFEPDTLIAKVKDLLGRSAARPAGPPPGPRPLSGPVPTVRAAPPPFAPAAAPAAAPPAPPPFAPSTSTVVFPSPAPAEPEMAFIPDEPFEDLDAGEPPSFQAPVTPLATVPPPPPPVVAPEEAEEFVPITAEESESLSGSAEDATATVMFKADALPWATPAAVPPPPAVEARAPVGPAPEGPAFEEILEEGEVGPGTFPAAPAPRPPVAVPAAPAPAAVSPFPAPAAVVPPPPEPSPASFADVAASIGEPPPEAAKPPSVAAQVDVPVEMVSQIAQRVVAQVSEKVVERIAWEVIPDLAEAMIKREIERLKAELQRLD